MRHNQKKPITGRISSRSGGGSAPIKPQKARRIIRAHHVLLKRKAQLEAKLLNHSLSSSDQVSLRQQIKDIENQIESAGGIERYQLASIAGQNESRGGDSSKLLVTWLDQLFQDLNVSDNTNNVDRCKLSLLEIGSLSVKNACSRSRLFERIERVDLNAQTPGIIKQDFMKRPDPRPNNQEDFFNVVSLSLVLNYVPDPLTRGQMLVKTRDYLNQAPSLEGKLGPLLFVVMPAPCMQNSRYLTEEKFLNMMECIGYKQIQRKLATKVIYWLFELENKPKYFKSFPKVLVNDGKVRNNFSIIL